MAIENYMTTRTISTTTTTSTTATTTTSTTTTTTNSYRVGGSSPKSEMETDGKEKELAPDTEMK